MKIVLHRAVGTELHRKLTVQCFSTDNANVLVLEMMPHHHAVFIVFILTMSEASRVCPTGGFELEARSRDGSSIAMVAAQTVNLTTVKIAPLKRTNTNQWSKTVS